MNLRVSANNTDSSGHQACTSQRSACRRTRAKEARTAAEVRHSCNGYRAGTCPSCSATKTMYGMLCVNVDSCLLVAVAPRLCVWKPSCRSLYPSRRCSGFVSCFHAPGACFTLWSRCGGCCFKALLKVWLICEAVGDCIWLVLWQISAAARVHAYKHALQHT